LKKQVIIRLTPEQKARLVKQAAEQGRSMNSYIANLIEQDSQIVRLPVITQKAYEEYINSPLDPRD